MLIPACSGCLKFIIFSNASSINFRCTRVLQTYDTNVTPQITDAFSFPCANNLTEVAVVASGGVAPLTYTIISKNRRYIFYGE